MGKPRDLANVVATGNILADGAVAPAELTGVTSTAAEINILDGVTATATELNLMDGVTATTAELNYVDGVTSNVQTQMDTKAPVAGPTFTGTLAAPTINASTALQIGGVAITATAAELNIMDGVTASASDLNGVAGINSNVQTQLNLKAPIDGPTFTGDVTLPDKIVHTGDTNTAIRFPADDTISFETSGSERFRVASAGQLGIGGATYGTSGQVLTSGGSGAAPSWVDAGGGAYEAVSDAAYTSGSSAIDFTVEPDYFYTLEFMGVGITAGGAELEIAASHDAFSSTKNIQWWVSRHDIWSATEAHQRGADSNYYFNAYGRLSYGNISGDTDPQSVHGLIHFAQKTGDYMTYFGTIQQPTNTSAESNYPQSVRSCGRVMSTDSINRIRLKPNNANIKATRVRLLRRA